ncbi:hypothetical protein BGX24_007988 [Mortierella sp. AD032]|nr:hypothetical protein BGX24_007988 [Mortierella sp. AD032]
MVATVATAATTTTSAASPTPTKGSGWSIFPGITVPNPFDIFKPTDPPKPSTTLGPTTTTTTTAVVKTATTTASTTTAASPSPTKKSGWSLFPGITIPNPFELFPHNHGRDPIKGNTESLARQGPAMVDAIDNNDDEQEDDYTEDDHSDFNDKQEDEEKDKEEVEQFKQRVKHDHQSPAEVDTNEDWDDEEVEPKQQANKGGQQKVLKQRSVEKKRRHHHHRRNNQKRHLVRRQTLSFHDVVQIARTISVSPPIKTMHLLTETPTSTPTPVAEAPIALPYTSVHVDPKDVLFKDAHSKKEEKPSAPPASPQSTASETDDPNIEEFESVIAQLVDEQAASFEESLAVIVNNIIQSDEMEPYEDLLFGRIVISKLEIPDINDDNALDFNTDDKVDTLYSFRASPSSKDSVFKGPRAVSRVSILTSIINTLLPPFILHFRADLRNFLYWICSPTSSAHINGRDTSGDDSWAEKIAKEDADKLIHPDGSIDLKALWDPRIGTIVLDCIRSHAQNVVNEVVGLAGTRFTEIKEFLVAQLRGLIGLPKWLLPFSSGSVSVDAQPTVDPSGQLQQNTEQEANEAEVHGADSQADVDLEEDNLTQKVEIEHAAVIVVQEETIPSPIHPDQRRRPSPASDSAQSLRKVQRTDSKFDDTDKTDEFLAWFVDSVVDELQNGYFANAKAATVSRVKSTKSQPTNSNGDPDEAGEYACAWIKERVEKVLQSLLQ